MATRRYTESQNIRFEKSVVELIDKALESEFCQDRDFNRSDLIRHLVRIGLTNFERSQPKNREFISEMDERVNGISSKDLFK